MATSKRERQKAARREKLERMQRSNQRRKNIRRGVIVAVVALLIFGSGYLLFAGKSKPSATTTTTTAAASATTSTSTTTTTAPTTTTTFAPVADPSPAGKFGTAPTVIVPSGKPPTFLESSDLIKGTGAEATNGKSLTVQYVLATYSSGKVVQSSWTSSPFTFTLGEGTVITGWEEGMVGMRVGGRRELIIPPALGYKNVAQGPGIAANDTLVFVVDLLKVN
jgi:peptidylprolyl isomerase